VKLVKKNRLNRQLEIEYAKVLEQDPTAFQYDEVYDDVVKKPKKELENPQKNKRLESKYIASLMEQNKKREQAYELVVERKMHKEIETDKTE